MKIHSKYVVVIVVVCLFVYFLLGVKIQYNGKKYKNKK